MRLARSPIIFPIQKASIAKMRCDAVKFQFVEYIKKLLAAIMVVRSSFYALICTGYAQGTVPCVDETRGWLTPPLTPVHKNTVRNGKSERISNLKERVRIIIFWSECKQLICALFIGASTGGFSRIHSPFGLCFRKLVAASSSLFYCLIPSRLVQERLYPKNGV